MIDTCRSISQSPWLTLNSCRRVGWIYTEPFQNDGEYRPETNTAKYDDTQCSSDRQSLWKVRLEKNSPAKPSNTQDHRKCGGHFELSCQELTSRLVVQGSQSQSSNYYNTTSKQYMSDARCVTFGIILIPA